MKKFTLLALAAFAAGTQMGSAEEINGITVSTADNPVYYTIKNMRAARLNYVNMEDGELTAGDIVDAEGEVVGHDDAGGSTLWMPEFLWNGESTPNIMDFPYMGLALVDNKFWTAFSAMTECMDRETTYWWFEKAKTVKNGVYIHNAVIGGAVKKNAENVNGRPSMSFSETGKGIYYVINLTEEQMENIGFEDEEFSTDAFALSNANKVADEDGNVVNPNSCLDMNNYVTYNYEVDSPDETEEVQERDENGELVFDEDGEPVMVEQPVKLKYGFVGVNRTWNPLNPGSNDNVRINNGSLFKVEAVQDKSIVEKAIENYKEKVAQAYRAQVTDILEKEKKSTIDRLGYLSNLPALYGSDKADKLEAIIATINNMSVDASKVNSQEDVDVYEAQIEGDMQAQYLRAIALAGDGTVITLQQMLAIRDWSAVEDGEEENVGNAYLSADGVGQIKYDGSLEIVDYPAVTCVLEADATCDWTMEWAGNGYRLKNGENYIRQHGNWDDLEQSMIDEIGYEPEDEEDTFWNHVDTNVMTWGLTTDPNLAAIFTFSANATAIQDITFNEANQEIVDTYGEELGYDLDDEEASNYLKNTTNIAHLESTDPEGNTTYLCRDNGAWGYIVDSWNAGNQYFANANCWKIEVKTAGEEVPDGIEEINATAKVAGIYDLQGRKVAKAGKGLYIINGVKTLVK